LEEGGKSSPVLGKPCLPPKKVRCKKLFEASWLLGMPGKNPGQSYRIKKYDVLSESTTEGGKERIRGKVFGIGHPRRVD